MAIKTIQNELILWTEVKYITALLGILRRYRRKATVLPMPDEAIDRVHQIARHQQHDSGLLFRDRNQQAVLDADDESDLDDDTYVEGDDDDDDDDDWLDDLDFDPIAEDEILNPPLALAGVDNDNNNDMINNNERESQKRNTTTTTTTQNTTQTTTMMNTKMNTKLRAKTKSPTRKVRMTNPPMSPSYNER